MGIFVMVIGDVYYIRKEDKVVYCCLKVIKVGEKLMDVFVEDFFDFDLKLFEEM